MNLLISLTALGVVAMFGGILKFRSLVMPLSVLGIIGASLMGIYAWNTNQSFLNDMMRMDNYAIAFSIVCMAGALLTILFFHFFHSEDEPHYAEAVSLMLFAVAGCVVMVSFTNLLMLFLGIEILSLSLYVLAGLRKKDLLSNEASLKYFLMGAFSTGFLLFGIALLYGTTGSFSTTQIAYQLGMAGMNGMAAMGLLLLMIGLLFKVAAVPFQFWAPDVYQGAPTIITGFMATVGKVAAFAAFLRLFQLCFAPSKEGYQLVIGAVAAITMLAGNIIAIYQSSMKRMLAYSSIAHAGYMLIAVMTLNASSNSSILFYSVAYSLASLSSFVIVMGVQQNRTHDRAEDFNGLGKTNPWIAFALAVSMLSLSGIPATAGFFGKFYVFSSAVSDGFIWLIAVAVISSFISVYYYLRPVIAAYSKPTHEPAMVMPRGTSTLLVILALLTIALGMLPGILAGII
jgi:NADH-quinone oxidoreductase subunit N